MNRFWRAVGGFLNEAEDAIFAAWHVLSNLRLPSK